ncbi:hypothetical protein [Sphingomonas morindae]|uniref:Integrase n=1 Tax=Sphingomonas morindae TaxID=1541170 RepID=A0ABY4X9B0_9SPHN|nr:hypothetical protein [Sphingomonas morindae]USI73542.1 hypothetical protein LHA26_03410 [Sphingomonas morindae]
MGIENGRLHGRVWVLYVGSRSGLSAYAKSHDGVWFARKEEIARWALQQRQFTPVVHRGPSSETGLP